MILGIGSDIVDLTRIKASMTRFGTRFLNRIFTPQERDIGQSRPQPHAYFAKRFAAKEAFFKALGTGLSKGLSWQDIEILNNDQGAPFVHVTGATKRYLLTHVAHLDQIHIHISLSDTNTLAQAYVILEKKDGTP